MVHSHELRKVKLHLPSLCKPDETCKKIGNPLSYYIRKLREIKGDETASED